MNMRFPRTDAAQWRVLQAVVEYGGFAQAAARLHRSQSSISYTIARLQEQIGVALLEPDGRRMRLTPAGSVLLREAAQLVDQFERLELRAAQLGQGWEAEVRLAVDALYPTGQLLEVLGQFSACCPDTRLQLHEVVMSGADEALFGGTVDLAIGTRVPPGFLGDWLFDAHFIAVAAPEHPLHQLDRALSVDDLAEHTQMVVRDSGAERPRDFGWLGARQRWTVSKTETSVAAVVSGLAFSWLPEHAVASLITEGRLRPLPLQSGQRRHLPIYLIQADPERSGPAAQRLCSLFKQAGASLTAAACLNR
jgi:DNA-binding transcriptional LysR family regulator